MASTIDFQNLVESAKARILTDGFRPSGVPKQQKKSEVTIHEAIRIGLSMRPDDSYYMYWNWEELGRFLRQAWRHLDDAASAILGRRTSAIALCFPGDTSLDIAVQLFDQVPKDQDLRIGVPVSRPLSPGEASRLPMSRTLVGSIVRAIAAVSEQRETSVGDVLSTVAVTSLHDVDLLRVLDVMIASDLSQREGSRPGSNVIIMRSLMRAFQSWETQERADPKSSRSFRGFLVASEEEANWSGLSDESLLRRLLRMAPETSEEEKKRINKFLMTS